jgi:hypothetical protein
MVDDVQRPKHAVQPKHTVQLPRFLVEEPVGLGEVVKRITTSIGVQPCGSCGQRAKRLDQWLRFSSSKRGATTHE